MMRGALLRYELRLFAKARLTWIVFTLLFAAMTWGAINGQRHAQDQQAAVERVRQHEAAALAESRAAIARYAQPAAALLPYWQDPSDVAGFMRYRLVAYAVKPPSPLAGIAVGQSRLLPFYLRIDLDYVAPPATAFDFVNPRALNLGDFDLAFVIVFVLPLALIALGATRLSAERDSGALPLLAVQMPSFRQLVMVKFGAMALVCVPFAVLASGAALLASGTPCWSAKSVDVMLLLALALAGFTAFWVALVALVASRIGVTGSYLRLLTLWIGFTFVVPAAGALVIDMAYPAPASLHYLEQLRGANDLTSAQRNAIFLKHLDTQPHYAPAALRLDKVPYATKMIFVQREVERQLKSSRDAAARQQAGAKSAADAVRWLSPAMVFDSLLQRAAGTGTERHRAFLEQTEAYTDRLRGFFWPRALEDAARPVTACRECAARMNFVEHHQIPRFAADQATEGVAAGIAGGTAYLCLLAAAMVFLLRRRRDIISP